MNKTKRLQLTKDVLGQLNFLCHKKQEHLVCMSFDSAGRLIKRRVVTIGLLDMVPTHPREVFAPVITDRAAYVIVAHNHPSGDPRPSDHDISTTQQLVAAGILLGVPVKDHIVIAARRYFSFAQHGML